MYKFISLIFIISLLSINLADTEMEKATIALIPIGEIDKDLLESLRENLKARFNKEVTIASSTKIPEHAHNNKRKQYYSTAILDQLLKEDKDAPYERILGIIDRDLYVPELNFVFGEARGRVAIISITRLREEYYGGAQNKDIFYKRALKEAVHELGHTYGLSHCSNPRCVMYFSNSLIDTDRKGSEFCPTCKGYIQDRD